MAGFCSRLQRMVLSKDLQRVRDRSLKLLALWLNKSRSRSTNTSCWKYRSRLQNPEVAMYSISQCATWLPFDLLLHRDHSVRTMEFPGSIL